MKILCICRAGLNRSRYMAELLREHGHDARYAGVDPRAPNPLTQQMIDWADIIIAARDAHAAILAERFRVNSKVIALDVRNDIYTSIPMHERVREQLLPLLTKLQGE
jgi:predicted protein tyrosine phosphatase